MNRTAKRFLTVLLLAIAGGIVGGRLVRRSGVHPQPTPAILDFSRGMMAAIVLICLFDIYWSSAAKNSAPTQSSESRSSRGFHLAVLNGGVLLLILSVPGLTHRFLPAGPLMTALGLAIEIAGIAFAIWSRRHLGANWSGQVRLATGHQLVRTGPYAHIRHPIYTGVLLMYLGVALVSGEIHALVALAVILLAYLRKIGLEEKLLAENFGSDWDAWQKETWALAPPLY
jgi:protein-S-isoprenylcysteine O-methyltransferase Ste14